LTLTCNPDFQFHASYGHDPRTHAQEFMFKGQWVQSTEWKQTNGQTDGQTDGRYLLLYAAG